MKVFTILVLCGLMIVSGSPTVAQKVADSKHEKAALKKAKKIRKKLTRGADFASLAKKYSADPGSAMRGGALGFVDQGQFVPEFERAVAELAPGEISTPVRTTFGYHIIELIERKGNKFKARHILIKP